MPGEDLLEVGLSVFTPFEQFEVVGLVFLVEVDPHAIVARPQPHEAVLLISKHGFAPSLILPQQQLHEVDEELDLQARALPVLLLARPLSSFVDAVKEALLRVDRVPVRKDLGLSMRLPLQLLRLPCPLSFKMRLNDLLHGALVLVAAHFVKAIL